MAVAEEKLNNLPGRFMAYPGFTRFCRAVRASFSLVGEGRP
jgi:hypothetical protein